MPSIVLLIFIVIINIASDRRTTTSPRKSAIARSHLTNTSIKITRFHVEQETGRGSYCGLADAE